tara:strand:- start:169 stop:723 length:555 start_codon:yes stop_codon:yes gene_type:complete
MLKKLLLIIFGINLISTSCNADRLNEMFFIGKMESHNKDFTLFFKTREKGILARGENYNYVTDYPQDLYIYDNNLKIASPLISYEWFPSHAKFFLQEYNFPVFPEDFAYYLLKDNNTLVMISAVKSFNKNFKFDIANKKLNLYPSDGKFDFIISSIAKSCGYLDFKDNYKCNYYKPLISNNLIN